MAVPGSPRTTKEPAGPQSARPQAARLVLGEVRARLCQREETPPEFSYELLATFARNELGAALTIPVVTLVLALALMVWVPANALLYWLAGVFLATSLKLALCRGFLSLPREAVQVRAWERRFVAVEAISAIAWALLTLVDFSSTNQATHTFIFAAVLVMICMRMMFASNILPVVYAGTIPLTVGLVLRFAATDNSFYWSLAAMAIGIHIYFAVLMRSLNANIQAMFAYRAEKDLLVAELEREKAIATAAAEEAQAASRAKSRFLATMSHELRTPLNAIMGFSEVMKTEMLGPLGSPTYREYASDIHRSGEHLLHLINEILDLSRIEAGRFTLREERVSVAGVAEDCVRLLNLRAESKQITLSLAIAEDVPDIWADERAIRQIVLNLLSNAVKFTQTGGRVRLSLAHEPRGPLVLVVYDNGPGIPEHELAEVMRPFGRGAAAQASAEGGTGLGLPIVQSLVELHQGQFKLESWQGRGTKATARFPANRVMAAMPVAKLANRESLRPAAYRGGQRRPAA